MSKSGIHINVRREREALEPQGEVMRNVTLLKTAPDSASEEVFAHFAGSAESLAQWKGLAGYALVIWDRAGTMGQAVLVSESSPYDRRVIPAIVAEALRDLNTLNRIDRALGTNETAS